MYTLYLAFLLIAPLSIIASNSNTEIEILGFTPRTRAEKKYKNNN